MWNSMRGPIWLAATVALLLSCGTKTGEPGDKLDAKSEALAGDTEPADIPGQPVGPGGGTVESSDGVAAVHIPDGASSVSIATSLWPEDPMPGDHSEPPAFVGVVDKDYVFAATPATLEKRVVLEVRLAGDSFSDDELSRLMLAGFNSDVDDRGPGGTPRYDAFVSDAQRDGNLIRVTSSVALRGNENARFTAVLASNPADRFVVAGVGRAADDPVFSGPFDGYVTADQKALADFEPLMARLKDALAKSYAYLTSPAGMGYTLSDKQAALWLPIQVAVRSMAVDPASGAKNLGAFTPAGMDEHGEPWIGMQFDLEAFSASDPVPAALEIAVAHELYHHLQYIYLSHAKVGGATTPAFQKMAAHRWWIESSTYWAQDQVYDAWYPKFVFTDRTARPLTRQPEPWDEYAGFPVWLWVEEHSGRELIREILLDASGWKTEDIEKNIIDVLSANGLHWPDFSAQYLYIKGFARNDGSPDTLGQTTTEDRAAPGDPLSIDLWHASRLGLPFAFVVDPADGHAKHQQSGNAFYRLALSGGPDSSQPMTWKPKGPLGGMTAVRLDLVNDTGADEATHLAIRLESGVPTPVVRVYEAGTVAPQVKADWLGDAMEADFTVFSQPAAGDSNAKVVIVSNPNPDAEATSSVVAEWRLMPAVLVKVSGDGQSGLAGRQLEQPLVVQVKSAGGRPMSGVEVHFSVVGESGTTLEPLETTTSDSSGTPGTAATHVKLGTVDGAVEVKAAAFDFLGRPVGSVQSFVLSAGNACGPPANCPAGCPAGQTCCRRWDCAHLEGCPGECVDLDTHNGNCGCCGNKCQGVGGTCCGGVCAAPALVVSEDPTDIVTEACCGPSADPSQWGDICKRQRRWALNTWCGPTCEQYCNLDGVWKKVNTAYDNEHCGVSCADCTASGGICCDGYCVNPAADPDHCGACGNHCSGPGATCCGGTCANPWWEDNHCLGCNVPCPESQTCVGGGAGCWQTGTEPNKPNCDGGIECGYLCAYPEDKTLCGCNGPCKDQEFCCGGVCMSYFNFDESHCGACNKPCKAGETCVLGNCHPAADVTGCKSPYGGCPYNESCCNGKCEINTFNDGFCAAVCGNACPAGKGCCGYSSAWSPTTDTCVDVLSNPQHCGACLHACALNQTCTSGECVAGP